MIFLYINKNINIRVNIFTIPIVMKMSTKTISSELISVNPLSKPPSTIFYDFKPNKKSRMEKLTTVMKKC